MLHRVRLELARCREYPDGSRRHGYEIMAPLDANGLLDAQEWRLGHGRGITTVMSFRGSAKRRARNPRITLGRGFRVLACGEPDRHGWLVHRAGGSGGATWLIDYNRDTSTDDETGYRLGAHRFQLDEYVSIRDDEGDLHTFKVAQLAAPSPAQRAAGA